MNIQGISGVKTAVSVIVALSVAGCAPAAANLRPRAVAGDQAAIFGHVEVLNHGTPVTSQCEVVLTDQDEQEKAPHLALGDGWVFTTVRAGPTYLSSVVCNIPGTVPDSSKYESRRLAFQARGGDRIVYFGHVRIDVRAEVQKDTGAPVGTGVLGALVVAAVRANMAEPKPAVSMASAYTDEKPMAGADVFGADVKDRLAEAVAEYQRRYGGDAQALKPEASIAGAAGDSVGVLADGASPTTAAGFALGQPVAAAEARCTGAGKVWEKVEGGAFSCNGTPAGLGVPAVVKLTACGDTICQVAIDAGADGAPWATLLARFGALTRRLAERHGDKHQHAMRALDGCAQGSTSCADSGRVRKSEIWRWADKSRVSLVLDGGPPGGAPSLRVVYSAGEAAAL